MDITGEKEATVCRRLLDMNIERLVSVCICTSHHKFYLGGMVKVTGGISLQNCTRLQSLQLCGLDLGDQQLLLPDTLTNIDFDKVKVTGGISLQNCTRLQSLELRRLDLGDQQLLLPDTLTNIVIKDVKVRGCISLQNCPQLQAIRLESINIPEYQLILSDSPTHMHTIDSNLPRVHHLQNCTLLQTLELKGVRFGKNKFLSAQNFENLQELILVDINLDDQELMLPNGLTSLCLKSVTTASGRNRDRNTIARQQHTKHSASISFMDTNCLGTLRLQNCTKLKTIVLTKINICNHELLLPEGVTSITLDSVNKAKDVKLPLQHCRSLQKLELRYGDKRVLPDSITKLDLYECLSFLTSLQNLSRLQTISLAVMDLGDLELKFPVSVKQVWLSRIKMSRGLPLNNCSQLIELEIKDMNLANTELKLPDSITHVEMRHVSMSALGVQELCHHFQRLPHHVTFNMGYSAIEPLHDFDEFIKRLKTMTDVQIRHFCRIKDIPFVSFLIQFNCNPSAASSELQT